MFRFCSLAAILLLGCSSSTSSSDCQQVIDLDNDGGPACVRLRCGDGTLGPCQQLDAGSTGATNTTPPACTTVSYGGSAGGGACEQEAHWTCGKDRYAVQCACPSRSCKCIKNGVTSSVVDYAYSCSDPSNCDRSLVATAACGFPTR